MWSVFVLVGLLFVVEAQVLERCLMCTSSIANQSCIDPVPEEFLQVCHLPMNSSCFTRIVAGNVERGCLSSLDNTTIAGCNTPTCQICHGSGCNAELFPAHRLACHQCSGPKNSPCAGIINTTATFCPVFNPDLDDLCYISMLKGVFERGCISTMTPNRCNTNKCDLCRGHGCNFGKPSSAHKTHSITNIVFTAMLSVAMIIINK